MTKITARELALSYFMFIDSRLEPGSLNVYPLIEKLIEIERALGSGDTIALRNLVMEAQECALMLQKKAVEDHSSELRLPVAEQP